MGSESDPAKELRDHLAEWLRLYRTAKDIAPYVQRQLESAEWDEGARRLIGRAGAPEEVTHNIDQIMTRVLGEVKISLPLMTDYQQFLDEGITTLSSGTVSATSSMVAVLIQIRASPDALPEIDSTIKEYEALQQKQGRFAEARVRLGIHFPSLVGLFDLAEHKFQLAKSDVRQVPDAATEMRTLLDKLKGELFAKAQVNQRENMTWLIMAGRLGTGASQQSTLLDQEVSRVPLIENLSELLKRRMAPDVRALSVAWMLVVDHVYVVCSCI